MTYIKTQYGLWFCIFCYTILPLEVRGRNDLIWLLKNSDNEKIEIIKKQTGEKRKA